jgi:uncharacterized delta-60 repeat protein
MGHTCEMTGWVRRRLSGSTAACTLAALMLALLVTAPATQAASWHLDPSFGRGGVAPVPGGQGTWSLLAPGPQGSLYVGAGMRRGGSFAVERLSAQGKLVHSFGHDGVVSTNAVEPDISSNSAQMLTLPDGKLLISGLDGNVNQVRLALTRFTSRGRLDRTFGHDGVAQYNLSAATGGTTGQVYVGVAGNGDIVAVHPIAAVGSIEIIRMLPSGALDPSFGSGGFVRLALPGENLTGNANSEVAIASDGSILLAFQETNVKSLFQPAVGEISPEGVPLDTFGNDGLALIPSALDPGAYTFNALFGLPDGVVEASLGYEAAHSELVRLAPAGILEPSFGTSGAAKIDQRASVISLGPGNETFYAGSAAGAGASSQALVVGGTLNSGQPDPALGGAAGERFALGLPAEAVALLPGPGVLSILDDGHVVRLSK